MNASAASTTVQLSEKDYEPLLWTCCGSAYGGPVFMLAIMLLRVAATGFGKPIMAVLTKY